MEGEDASQSGVMGIQHQPLPDPPKQKATGMCHSSRRSGGVNRCVHTCKECMQHPHPQGWGPAAASLSPLLHGAPVAAPVSWLGHVESILEVKSHETALTCFLCRDGAGSGSTVHWSGAQPSPGSGSVALHHCPEQQSGSWLEGSVPLQQVNESTETFLSCVLRGGRRTDIFRRCCVTRGAESAAALASAGISWELLGSSAAFHHLKAGS